MKLYLTDFNLYLTSSIVISISVLFSFATHAGDGWSSVTNVNNSNTDNISKNDTITSVYEVTTRGRLHEPDIIDASGTGYSGYELNKIQDLFRICPEEVVVFIHGWGNDEKEAKERLDRVKMSLEHNSYTHISLVGFSWDSNVDWLPVKTNAKENGQKLAQLLLNYMINCSMNNNINQNEQLQQQDRNQENTKIRLIAHSVGSRIILSALDSLHQNTIWNNITNNFKIESVDLMGAAVDNEEVSMESIDKFNQPWFAHDPVGVKDRLS
jgi:Alpha/beta hydrolase of unknown function (DUF900)